MNVGDIAGDIGGIAGCRYRRYRKQSSPTILRGAEAGDTGGNVGDTGGIYLFLEYL